jgi:hypothetical protein
MILHIRGLPLEFLYLNAALLARSMYADSKSCDRQPLPTFVIFPPSRVNAQLDPNSTLHLHIWCAKNITSHY